MSSSFIPAAPVTVPSAASPVVRADFPSWLPAMLVKELRQGLRTRGFVGVFIGFQIVMMLMMLSTILGSAFGNATSRAMLSSTVNGFYWTLLAIQLLVVTPARALGSLQAELDSRTLDLLMLTRLTAWRIVIGKWISLMAQASLLLIAMLPYGIVRYFIGSVDLVQDAGFCVRLLSGCAVLTAAGLLNSGMPKVVRILVPIVIVFGLQASIPFLSRMGFSPFGGSPTVVAAASGGVAASLIWWYNGALVLALFLVGAVRRIAPPAENHVRSTRILLLLSLMPIPIWALTGSAGVARDQIHIAAIILFVGCAIELTSWRMPMGAHWSRSLTRSGLGRAAGRLLLPGWPSGFAFAVLATGLITLCTLIPGVADASHSYRWTWLPLLALTALVFPAVVLSFFRNAGRSSLGFYFLIFGSCSVLTGFTAMVSANAATRLTDLLPFAQTLPIAGWWVTVFSTNPPTSTVMMFQVLLSVIVLLGAGWQSRPYWRRAAKVAPHPQAVAR